MTNLDKFPEHIQINLKNDSAFYSMDVRENILLAKQDPDYLGEVLIANENLIWHSVHKYIGKPDVITNNNCIEKDDILQLGRLGFIKSVKAFDVERGVRFSSFSVTAIVREIRCFLRDSASVIRPTRTANDILNKISRIEADLGYLPTTDEIAFLLDESEDKISKALRIGKTVKYLDEPIHNDTGSVTVMDTLESSEGIETNVLDKVYVDTVIGIVKERLTEKEMCVLDHRMNGLNQTQIAKCENISQMRVSRIMQKVASLIQDDVQLNV
ncbi:sigma-70 family RNA polymerase sigma factor [Solibacillus silvestris]